jgi:hypothetical protein
MINNMKYLKLLLSAGLISLGSLVYAQEDLLQELEAETKDTLKKDYVSATFKGTKIINAESVETTPAGSLQFMISHRFGTLNSGAYELFGLDEATMRLNFSYGFGQRLELGFGRSTVGKTYDVYGKYKILRQVFGKGSPVTATALFRSTVYTVKTAEKEFFAQRLSYTSQLLIARKFTDRFSLQLMPSYIHRNLVETREDRNDIWSLGAGGRLKFSRRMAVTGEYWYVPGDQLRSQFHNSASVGIDIETGGHVFQLHLTNSRGMTDRQFIAETQGDWFDGDIMLGFNMTRVFTISEKRAARGDW